VALLVEIGERDALEVLRREVLGVVAHDLRNPLSALRMTLTMLLRSKDMTVERRVQLAERMMGTLGRMEGMVATLVEHARAEAGVELRLARERVDLAALLERARKELEPLFPGRAIVVDRRGALEGEWDGPRLERVLSHLLGNALKHGDEGTSVTITIDGAKDGIVSLSINNGGPPISPELLPHLFEAFTIGPTGPEERRRSVGLGLFIVRHLVQAHGGAVDVTSSASDGTTFTVVLPRRAPPAGAS
jgi:signal transduction histidine kinase